MIQSIISGFCSSITIITEPIEFSNQGSRDYLLQDYIHWGLLFPEDSCGLGEDALNKALHSNSSGLALEITSQWHPSIRSLLELQDESLTSRTRVYSASPEIGTWEPSRCDRPHVSIWRCRCRGRPQRCCSSSPDHCR